MGRLNSQARCPSGSATTASPPHEPTAGRNSGIAFFRLRPRVRSRGQPVHHAVLMVPRGHRRPGPPTRGPTVRTALGRDRFATERRTTLRGPPPFVTLLGIPALASATPPPHRPARSRWRRTRTTRQGVLVVGLRLGRLPPGVRRQRPHIGFGCRGSERPVRKPCRHPCTARPSRPAAGGPPLPAPSHDRALALALARPAPERPGPKVPPGGAAKPCARGSWAVRQEPGSACVVRVCDPGHCQERLLRGAGPSPGAGPAPARGPEARDRGVSGWVPIGGKARPVGVFRPVAGRVV